MNGNTDYEAIMEEYGDEAFDDESFRSAEFLGDLVRNIGSGVGSVASGLGNVVSGLFGGPQRPPIPQVQVRPSGSGVSTATLQTPAGTANLRLPAPVPTRDEFQQAVGRLEGAINAVTTRVNTTQNDLRSLTTRVGTVVADTQKEVLKVRTDTRQMLAKGQNVQNAKFVKLRQDISSQQMTNLMLSIMTQKQLQDQLDDHTHSLTLQQNDVPSATAPQKTITTSASSADSSDNNAMMFLPLMMMGSPGSGSGDNNMMMMMMMTAFK